MGFIKKNLGFILSILGAGLTVLTNINDTKERDAKIAEAVDKAIAERQN